MKPITLLIAVLLYSCDSPPKKYVLEDRRPEKAVFPDQEMMDQEECSNEPVEASWFTESSRIDGGKYTVYSGNDRVFVLNAEKDTVFKLNRPGSGKFLDFNQDGYQDVYIDYITNLPEVHDLALFEPVSKTFRLVDSFDRYPASEKIPGTPYYYSYYRSGCADMNWGSDLFYIEEYKTHLIGKIEGVECENDPKPGVFVYKVAGKKERLVRTFKTDVLTKYTKYKWGFIADYWKKNYNRFLPETLTFNGQLYKKYTAAFRFDQFRVDTFQPGKLKLPDFSGVTIPYCSYLNENEWKEHVLSECRKGVNFAGHYTLAEWGCGMMCQNMCIVDRLTGVIHFPDIPEDHIDGYYGVRYQKDSRMIITNAALLDDYPGYFLVEYGIFPQVYEWKNERAIRLE